MSSDDAKSYLSKREVPRLFESLMTGLMFHRPDDHIDYLIGCLKKVKLDGKPSLPWDAFVDLKKTPLPPITPPENGNTAQHRPTSRGSRPQSRGSRPQSRGSRPSSRNKATVEELNKSSPLPPIGQKIQLPDVPIVLIIGGPGSGKLTQAERIVDRYTGWVHVCMGDILRNQIHGDKSAEKKWAMVSDLMSKGEMAPREVAMELLIKNLQKHGDAAGFIVEGYPRDMKQAEELDQFIGRVDLVIVLDCDESYLSTRLLKRGAVTGRLDDNIDAVAKRIMFFKQNTLPVIKYYDDQQKVEVLEGGRQPDAIEADISKLYNEYFYGKGDKPVVVTKPIAPSPPPGAKTNNRRQSPGIHDEPDNQTLLQAAQDTQAADVTIIDTGRKPHLPQAPIVFIAGGPGSGKGTQCKKLIERYPDFVHLSMGDILRTKISTEGTADAKWDMVSTLLQKGEMAPREMTIDLLSDAMKENKDAKVFIVEGYPRDISQMEEFSKHIGGLGFAIILDCEEYYLQKRLIERGAQTERIDHNLSAISNRLNFFKQNTLPVLKYLEDEEGKLVVISGDRDEEEIFYDLCTVFDMAFYGTVPQTALPPTSQSAPQPVVEEVIEATIIPISNTTTGNTIANPHRTALLDSSN